MTRPAEGGVSVRDLVGVVFRHRSAAMICYAVIVLGTALYAFFWPPTYEATVRYLVKNDRLEPLLTAGQDAIRTVSRPSVTDADLNSETEIMQSRAVLERTVREGRLENLPEHWALRLLRRPIEFGKEVYNGYHDRPGEDPLGKAVRRLGTAIDVDLQRESAVILVRLRWGHPRAAEELLSLHSAAYLAQHLAVRRAPDAQQFFQAQMARATAELARIDEEIAAIRPGATSAQLEADRALAARQASEFDAEWRRARALQQEDRARLQRVAEELRPLPQRVPLEDRTIVSAQALETLKLRVMDLRLQETRLLQQYAPAHRQVTQVQERLAEAERMLEAEEARAYVERTTGRNETADALDRDLRTTRVEIGAREARASAMVAQAEAFRAEVSRLERQAHQLRELERTREAVVHSLDDYVRQFEEARVNDAMQFVNVAVIEPVSAGASPVWPAAGLLMKLALVIGLIVSLALPFALDVADHRVRSDRDLEALGVPVLSVLDRYQGKGEESLLA